MNYAQKLAFALVFLIVFMSFPVIAESNSELIHDTFLSYHTTDGKQHTGEYSLPYILQNYNVFTSGDCAVSHMIGPIVVGGDFSGSLGGLTVGAVDAHPHEFPSYVGSTIISKDILYFNDSIYFYTRSTNQTAYRVIGKDHTIREDAVVRANAFISDNAMSLILQEIEAQQEEEIVKIDSQLASLENDHYEFENPYGNKIQLTLESGYRYDMTGITVDMIDIKTAQNAAADIIILNNDQTVKMPVVLFDGQEAGSIEYGSNMGAVFMAPNAVQYIGPEHGHAGHVVAPKAVVQVNAGDFNGCIIAKSITGNHLGNKKGEGHMWPYHGQLLRHQPQAAEVCFKVDKTLDGEECGLNLFHFVLKDEHGTTLQEIENDHGTVTFHPMFFSESGQFTFYILEAEGHDSQILYDDTVYKATVNVTCPRDYEVEILWERNGVPYRGIPIFENQTIQQLPETGDLGNPALMAALICLSFAALSLYWIKAKRCR